MTDLAAIKDELRTLLEKATPGPWRRGYKDGSGKDSITAPDKRRGVRMDQRAVVSGGQDGWGVNLGVQDAADAALIVAAVNALPLLLADTPSVEPPKHMAECTHGGGAGSHEFCLCACHRPSVEPLDVERLARALDLCGIGLAEGGRPASEWAAAIATEYAAEPHVHEWWDADDDETAWHCRGCGLTEYPGDPGIGDSAPNEDWSCIDCGIPLEPGAPPICEECVDG